ncbi:uncharacterized protein BP01DRAFT_362346 [Aspergillus saccharolyticus JOP 1030-1]|uniref:Oxidoreductase acuF-like C2H2 type zinc-finger domain-containing protein n=1 Tax=Aspergillus saccharolyticus JOP 1030-1 TaxID=1450539 RepID=A0A318ZPA5_9EURO|nr:hypothetical protein BP01DRAFT_362346 [Aspergillus saccharolyticus JOP 1030-1]PYH49419.1 hypothetical protein BP01DRAFT_362346 [Aspergillus saccharolyticus JOP 1030-1]
MNPPGTAPLINLARQCQTELDKLASQFVHNVRSFRIHQIQFRSWLKDFAVCNTQTPDISLDWRVRNKLEARCALYIRLESLLLTIRSSERKLRGAAAAAAAEAEAGTADESGVSTPAAGLSAAGTLALALAVVPLSEAVGSDGTSTVVSPVMSPVTAIVPSAVTSPVVSPLSSPVMSPASEADSEDSGDDGDDDEEEEEEEEEEETDEEDSDNESSDSSSDSHGQLEEIDAFTELLIYCRNDIFAIIRYLDGDAERLARTSSTYAPSPLMAQHPEYVVRDEWEADVNEVFRLVVQNTVHHRCKVHDRVLETRIVETVCQRRKALNYHWRYQDGSPMNILRRNLNPPTFILALWDIELGNHPALPKLRPGQTEFECPYCRFTLPAHYAIPSEWKKHVLADLEPYTCIIPHCTHPTQTFATIPQWLYHMEVAHASKWHCFEPACRQRTFHTQIAFEQHGINAHNYTPQQTKHITESARRPLPAVFTVCPFCGPRPDHDPPSQLRDDGAAYIGNPRAFAAAQRLYSHVAAHLEEFALLAIPYRPRRRLPAAYILWYALTLGPNVFRGLTPQEIRRVVMPPRRRRRRPGRGRTRHRQRQRRRSGGRSDGRRGREGRRDGPGGAGIGRAGGRRVESDSDSDPDSEVEGVYAGDPYSDSESDSDWEWDFSDQLVRPRPRQPLSSLNDLFFGRRRRFPHSSVSSGSSLSWSGPPTPVGPDISDLVTIVTDYADFEIYEDPEDSEVMGMEDVVVNGLPGWEDYQGEV